MEPNVYLPPHFAAKDPEHAREIVTSHPFASLISNDDEGLPFVTHLPLHLEPPASGEEGGEASPWVLLGHMARANPHWRYLQARPTAVVTFVGPHAYMSPRVYPDLVRVPTWNYMAVHGTVQATLIEEPLAKDRLLKKLIGDHDPAYAPQWMGLGTDYQHKMLAGIVAFELRVTRLQTKIKINQHRPESHARMREVYAAGNDHDRALGEWMDKLGLNGPQE